MTTKNTKVVKANNSKELATINFETSDFKFDISEMENGLKSFDVMYKSTSISTGFTSNKIKSYGVLDLEKAKFWKGQLEKLYKAFSSSADVWVWIKGMIANNVITEQLG